MVLSLEEGDEAELKCVDRALDPEPVLTTPCSAWLLLCGNGISVPLCGPSGGPFRWGFGIRFRTPLPWPAASPGRERPSGKQMPSGCWRCWRIWGRGELQRPSEGLYRGGTPAGGVAVSPEEKNGSQPNQTSCAEPETKTERIAVLSACAEEAMDYARRKAKFAPMQAALLELLCSLGPVR